MVTDPLPKGTVSLRAQDIQTGLQEYNVPEFRGLLELGWAARIAVHLRSAGPVARERLSFVAEHLFGVNKWGLPDALRILEEAELVRQVGSGAGTLVIPQEIPYFDDLYPQLDEVADANKLNEHERLSIDLLHTLSRAPVPAHLLFERTGAEKDVFRRVLAIGKEGSYIDRVPCGSLDVLSSPMYFSENPQEFAAVVNKYGEAAVTRVFSLLREHAGWPLALIEQGDIGGEQLKGVELDVARAIVRRALTQPPTITAHRKTQAFVFTPRVGTDRIEVIEKEVYERAIAIVAAIRHGQHFEHWKIHSPIALLRKLQSGSRITPPTDAKDQYRNLAMRQVVRLDPPPPAHFEAIQLIDNSENRRAIELSIEMFSGHGGDTSREPSRDAAELLTSDAAYQEYIRGIGSIRARKNVPMTPGEVDRHFDTLLEHCMKGP